MDLLADDILKALDVQKTGCGCTIEMPHPDSPPPQFPTYEDGVLPAECLKRIAEFVPACPCATSTEARYRIRRQLIEEFWRGDRERIYFVEEPFIAEAQAVFNEAYAHNWHVSIHVDVSNEMPYGVKLTPKKNTDIRETS
jgi:hypothetical protein